LATKAAAVRTFHHAGRTSTAQNPASVARPLSAAAPLPTIAKRCLAGSTGVRMREATKANPRGRGGRIQPQYPFTNVLSSATLAEEHAMKEFEPTIPRVTLGLAAAGMTVLTLGSLVVWPSRMDVESQTYHCLQTATQASDGATQVSLSPSCIDVVGVRAQKTAFEPTDEAVARSAHPTGS
jgi:hypothetical protein